MNVILVLAHWINQHERELAMEEMQAILNLRKEGETVRGTAQTLSIANETICNEKERNHWYTELHT